MTHPRFGARADVPLAPTSTRLQHLLELIKRSREIIEQLLRGDPPVGIFSNGHQFLYGVDARLLWAAIFQMMVDFVVARAEVMKVLQIAGNVRAWIDLADLQEAKEQCQEALQTLAEAARLVRSGGAYLNREQELEEIISAQWRCLHVSGQPEKALATLRDGLREVPTSKVLRELINR